MLSSSVGLLIGIPGPWWFNREEIQRRNLASLISENKVQDAKLILTARMFPL